MFFLWVEVPTAPPQKQGRHRHTPRRSGLHFFSPERADRELPVPELPHTEKAPDPVSRFPAVRLIAVLLFLLAVGAYYLDLRPQFMNWGATEQEQRMTLPGDNLMGEDPQYFTRAITINAAPAVVWQWIAQMGQDRAGFYSNTWLENLTGADIHNASTLHPEWRERRVGDQVLLARRDLFGGIFSAVAQTTIVGFERERWIAFIPTRFVLQPIGKATTRLLVREPLPASPLSRFFASFTWDPMHYIMQARMLRGIKERAENLPLVSPQLALAGRIGWCLGALGLVLAFLREHDRLPFLLLPLFWALPVVLFTRDWEAGLTAFLLLGVPIGGAVFFGRKWWLFLPLLAMAVVATLLLSPDPYSFLGIALGSAALVSRAVVS